MPEFAPVISVSTLDGANGFRLDGALDDLSGRSVAGGGNFNGDGFADLLIGARDFGGADRGLAWVVFGAAANPAAESLAARVSAGTAYRFQGEAAGDQAGYSVSNAGDVNGDGLDDILIGASRADPDAAAGNRGASYLVFGGLANLEVLDISDGSNNNQISLANLNPSRGYRFDGVANGDYSGSSVSGAGDIDGDGFADLIVGAPSANTLGGTDNGATYVIFGGANLADLDNDDGVIDGRINLNLISAGQGVRLDGQRTNADDFSGRSVSAAGDVNGDGFDDVIIGASNADPNSGAANGDEGAAYILFGQSRADLPVSIDLAQYFFNPLLTRLDGVSGVGTGDRAGSSVSGLGDINGDGFDDVLIGAISAASLDGENSAGSAYVVFGKSGWGGQLDLARLDGTNGFRLVGPRFGDYAGGAVSGAGDVNGDGFQDLLIAARGTDRVGGNYAGSAYVVFGKAAGFAATIDLGSLDGNDGFRIDGVAEQDRLGRSVAAAGDVNNDGFDDVIVGADGTDNGADDTGSSYIVYGHRAQSSVTRIGTELDNRINGGEGDDAVSGLDGADTLIGWEGDDLILGGQGKDVLDGGSEDDRLEGGSGKDSFRASAGDDVVLGGSGADLLDFSAFATAVTADLAAGLATTVNDSATVTFSSISSLTGGGGADRFTGDGRANLLSGAGGKDTLIGAGGDDTLGGGLLQDRLTGGSGLDVFDYNATAETGVTGGTRDIITDFVVAEDRIDLSGIDAVAGGGASNDTFAFLGTAAFTAAGQVRVTQSGADTLVEINTSGAGGAESSILLLGVTAGTLTEADFVL